MDLLLKAALLGLLFAPFAPRPASVPGNYLVTAKVGAPFTISPFDTRSQVFCDDLSVVQVSEIFATTFHLKGLKEGATVCGFTGGYCRRGQACRSLYAITVVP